MKPFSNTPEPPPWVKPSEWSDYKWQFKSSLKSINDFKTYFELCENEAISFDKMNQLFQIRVTPYYASLADKKDPNCPVRKILMPHKNELNEATQEMLDPLGENKNNPESRIIHRYTDRVLFLVTDFCSVYCRYCTRKHFTAKGHSFINSKDYDLALSYIKSNTQIREVILSGGDPLTLSNEKLDKILSDIKAIEHVDLIRIGSRIPVVNPYRIDEDLVEIFKKNKPVYLMNHFNHPKELTELAAEKLELLVDNGVPNFNQMVLLNGINNHPAIVYALSRRLLKLRVKPYYMFQCDPSIGTDHLRTSIEDSMQIQKELWGRASGLSMPNLSIDIPNGGGKVGVVPNFLKEVKDNSYTYEGWDGVIENYINPDPASLKKPDISNYKTEWDQLSNN